MPYFLHKLKSWQSFTYEHFAVSLDIIRIGVLAGHWQNLGPRHSLMPLPPLPAMTMAVTKPPRTTRTALKRMYTKNPTRPISIWTRTTLLQERWPQQANQGQQITGKDNEASGFNDQSRNLQSTPATAGAAGGTGNNGNGTTPTPPTTGTLNVCKEVIDNPDLVSSLLTLHSHSLLRVPTLPNSLVVQIAPKSQCLKVHTVSVKHLWNSPSLYITVSGDCTQDAPMVQTFHGSIKAGETQTCTGN